VDTSAPTTGCDLAIEVRDIEKRFGRNVALDGVSFGVSPGTCLVLLGPNGAGKTTLIRMLCTLAIPTAGTARICGHDVRAHAQQVRRRVGVLSHESFLYETLTAMENLRFYARMHGVDSSRERLEELLALVELLERADAPAGTMSRGMSKRLALARCLLHDPSVLLLDEPYSGLDPHGADILTRYIKDLRKKGCTILLTTHQLDRGSDVADHVGVLVRGKLAFWGERAALEPHDLQTEYTRAVSGGGE